MITLKLFKNQKEVGEIKFKDDEKFLMACNFAQKWKGKEPKKNDFNIFFVIKNGSRGQ